MLHHCHHPSQQGFRGHRQAFYATFTDPEFPFGIMPDHVIHHLCRNRWCVNPAHLVAVDPETHRAFHAGGGRPRGRRNNTSGLHKAFHAEALYSKTLEEYHTPERKRLFRIFKEKFSN